MQDQRSLGLPTFYEAHKTITKLKSLVDLWTSEEKNWNVVANIDLHTVRAKVSQ